MGLAGPLACRVFPSRHRWLPSSWSTKSNGGAWFVLEPGDGCVRTTTGRRTTCRPHARLPCTKECLPNGKGVLPEGPDNPRCVHQTGGGDAMGTQAMAGAHIRWDGG